MDDEHNTKLSGSAEHNINLSGSAEQVDCDETTPLIGTPKSSNRIISSCFKHRKKLIVAGLLAIIIGD